VGTQNFSTANDPHYKDPMPQQWSATVERQLGARQALRLTYSGFHSADLTMAPDLNQIQPNTVGFANLPAESRPFPNWSRITTRDNGGYQDYHDVVVQLRGSLNRWGLSHTTTYKWAHSVDNIEDRGAGQGDFQTEINGRTDNRFDPDYLRGPTTNTLQSSELGPARDESHEHRLPAHHVPVLDLSAEDDRARGTDHVLRAGRHTTSPDEFSARVTATLQLRYCGPVSSPGANGIAAPAEGC
jgi:hypothetical protein